MQGNILESALQKPLSNLVHRLTMACGHGSFEEDFYISGFFLNQPVFLGETQCDLRLMP